MFKLLSNAIIAVSLMLAASAPAWAGKPHDKNCPAAKHQHGKRVAAAKAQPARGIMLVEHRKQDVQILSFGP